MWALADAKRCSGSSVHKHQNWKDFKLRTAFKLCVYRSNCAVDIFLLHCYCPKHVFGWPHVAIFC